MFNLNHQWEICKNIVLLQLTIGLQCVHDNVDDGENAHDSFIHLCRHSFIHSFLAPVKLYIFGGFVLLFFQLMRCADRTGPDGSERL